MTTPRDTLSDIWSEAVNSYPELGQKYGTDPSKISLAGLRHYKKLRASRPTTPAYALPPSTPPSAPASVPPSAPASVLPPAPPVPGTPVPSPDDSYLARYRRGEIPDSILNKWRPLAKPRYDTGEPAVDPKPVDWDKRKKDFFDMAKDLSIRTFGYGILNVFHETEATRALPNEASWWQRVKAEFEPITRGIGAWTETFKPGAGHISRPLIPGVRRRYNELRDRGHGPMASAQAAYEQSAGAGEIPLFQQIASESLTDPVELLPTVGIAGGVTRGVARALPRVAGRAALAKAAPDVAKAPVSISPDVAARPAPQPVQAMMPLQPSIFDDVPIETTTPARVAGDVPVADERMTFGMGTPESRYRYALEDPDLHPSLDRFLDEGVTGISTESQVTANLFRVTRGNPDASVTIYRAVPKDVSSIDPGDWIALDRKYAEMHLRNPSDRIISREVTAKDISWARTSDDEWLFTPPAPAADAFPAPQSIQSISFGDVKAGDVVDITTRQSAREGWRPPHADQRADSPFWPFKAPAGPISGKVSGIGTSEIAGKSSRHISINGEIIPEDAITDIQIKTIPAGFPDTGFMPADELLGRQQAEAAQAAKEWGETPEVFRKGIPKPPEPEDWQSRVPAGRPDWMSRRGQDSLIPITEKERTGQLSLLGDWTDVGKDIVEVSSPHRYDELVPGDMLTPDGVIPKMVEAFQKGFIWIKPKPNEGELAGLPGHLSAFTAKRNRLAEAMFGTVKKPGWNKAQQKKELANNRAKVVEYVERLSYRQNKFDLGDYGSQGKLDLDSPKPWIKKNEHKVEMDRWLEEYYTFSTERNMWIRKTDRPITTTSRGMKSAVEESELAQLMNDTVPAGIGDLVENVKKEAEKAGEQISSWVENVNFGLGMPKLLDDAQANIKELTSRLIIPSEQNSIKGIKGFLTGGRAPAEIDTFMRRFFGNEQLNKELLNDIAARGRTEMQELGWVDSRGVVTELGWGTADTPGPVRLLHRALHEKGKALEEFKQKTGPSGMRQYWNLRILAGQEEVLTKAVLNPRDPDFKLMNSEDYFYRGMRLDSDITGDAASETFHVGTLGRKQSYQLSRSHKTYTELENAGYVPLFQNPYDQAMFRARMGFHTRIRMQLLDALKDPSVNMAKRVWDDMEKAALRADGWRTVENTGPALKGDKGMWVPKKNEAIPNAEEDAVLHHSEWFFPENVAKVMEEMFAPKKPLWKALRSEKFIPVLNVTVKLDDLFFIPKRANLFGSLFQQVDFAVRMTASIWQQSVVHPVFDSMHLIGKGDIEGSFKQFLIGTAGAPQSIFWRIPKALTKMGWANLSPGYRDVLRKRLMSSKPILPGEEFKEYTWENFVRNGLHVRDDTIFLGENLTPIWQQARDEVMLVKGLKAVPRALKHVEGAMQKGLFDGVYPAAIMQDVEKNLLPLVRALNPDLNPDQVMGTVAYLANLKWSTIPAHQSVFRGHLKEGLTRIAFSLNEFEAIGRQTTGMLRGEHKRFWVEYGASVITFTALMGGLIHFTTTSLTKTKDGKLKPDFKMGKWLPMDRYIPFWSRSYHKLGFGYNSKFLSPDIPVLTRSGDRAMLDLLNQLDFFFRITDGTNGFPLTGFFNSRLGSMPRALINQGRGKDYMGKDIKEWGYGQRAVQFVYDSLAPIGAGQLAVALAREAMKERYVPGQGFGAAPALGLETPLIQEGAKARHILPSIEARLGLGGIAVQAVGLNLKAVRTEDIKDEMVRNVFGKAGGHHDFPDLVLKSWQELSRHPEKTTLAKIVFQDIRNITRNKEISLRQEEGYEQFYDGFSKYIYERRQIAKERLKKQADIVNEQTKMLWNPSLTEAWSPSTFKEKLRAINANYQAKIAGLEKVYREDPAVAARFKEWETKAPDRAEAPLDWAIYRYFKIRKEAADTITGKLDYNKFKTLWAKETAQWDDEEAKESGGLLERFDVWQNQSQQHPFVEEYYDALKRIEDSGYWNDLDNDIMQRLEQVYPNARQVWSEYLIASVEERRRLASHADFGIQTVIKTMDKARKANRYRMVMQNPELDRDLIKWFGNTPHLHENRMYFLELYGKLPSSIRKMPYK